MPFLSFAPSFLWLTALCTCATFASAEPLDRRYENQEIQVDASKHDLQFFNFVTRPDIDAPRWDLKIYNESALAPGYWFMSPYGIVSQTDHDKAYVGPHIYDSHGELVWSGVTTFDGYNCFDFKVSQVDGKDMLSAIVPHDDRSVILNNHYENHADVDTGINKLSLNMHDFEVVDNGTKALYLTRDLKGASIEDSRSVGFNGHCNVEFTGFEERDLATGEITFRWTPENRIGLIESTMVTRKMGRICNGPPWDYLHINSIDKLPDGDYLLSGRRSYALYKISHKDGSIVWRFGGKKSNFKFEGHFSGQHDARCLSQNSTHMVVSVMDNASGPGRPLKTNPNSRGLVMSLNTKTMVAEVLKRFDHPRGGYAPARGNFQTLPNGNGFLGWTSDALQSEHTPDGEVIMEASISSGLKTYRAYKFPWVGRPKYPPEVRSKVFSIDDDLVTAVYVSWNGATEVAHWELYKTNADGTVSEQVTSMKRAGFETALTYRGYAGHVMVVGVDRKGQKLGQSRIVKTLGLMDKLHPDVIKETEWEQQQSGGPPDHTSLKNDVESVFSNPIFAFFGGILFCVAAGMSIWAVLRARGKDVLPWQRKQKRSYAALSDSDDGMEDEKFFDQDNRELDEVPRSDDGA